MTKRRTAFDYPFIPQGGRLSACDGLANGLQKRLSRRQPQQEMSNEILMPCLRSRIGLELFE